MAHLRQMYPERLEAKDDEELREFCREGIARANYLNIRSEYDVARFPEYRVFLGESFGPRPVLAARHLWGDGSGSCTMDRLDECFRTHEGRRQ